MRHVKMLRATARPVTSRRLYSAERALARERAVYPLFSDQLAEEQPTPDKRIQDLDDEQARNWNRIRRQVARTWRAARRVLQSLPEAKQKELSERWNNGPWPGTAEYFADFIRHAV